MPIKRIFLIFLAVILVAGLLGCNQPEPPAEPAAPAIIIDTPRFMNLLPFPLGPDQSARPLNNGLKEKALEKYQLNSHSLGWLLMPDTTLNDVVMFAPEEEDPFFYLRRGFDKKDLSQGTYFIDSLSHFDGGRDGMSQNIVIYGHSMSDNPNTEWFSQYKKLRDPNWAKNHPYLYFSTLEENMAWEIFAVFDTHVDFIYNVANPTTVKYQEILDGARARSIYNYNVDVTTDDHIITMSTCIYNYNGRSLSYPNNYRYVVMARLVPLGEELHKTADFTVNPEPYQDK